MCPTLLSVGIFEFHAYTVMMALAFLVGVLLAIRENYKLENPYPATPLIGIWVFGGALLGAKAYWILQYDSPLHLYRAIFVWTGGMVYYGGLIGGLVGAIAYLKWKRIPLLAAADIALPYEALAHGIGRLGCFLNGCCWGRVTDVPWAVQYPDSTSWGAYGQHLEQGRIGHDALHSLPVHPTQLYAACALLAMFFILRWVYKHQKIPGTVVVCYLFLYGVQRFTVECFRADTPRSIYTMSLSQSIALVMALIGAVLGLVYIVRYVVANTNKEAEEP